MNELYPIFLKLRGKRVLVAGGGAMASLRVKQLMRTGARLTVIAPEISPEIKKLAKAGRIRVIQRQFRRADLWRSCFFAVGATDDPAAQKAVAEAAERLGILYNVVDKPELSNFYTPAVVKRGGLKIAICSEGQSPVLSGRLRRILDEALPKEAGEWTAQLGKLRQRLKEVFPRDMEKRKRLINKLIDRAR